MKLTHGPGSPAEGGCWMVAVQQYTENEGWHDHPACVDPIIRTLCIGLNDKCGDGEREALIGPHLFAPVGTNDLSLRDARLKRVVRFALDCEADALDKAGLEHELRKDFDTFEKAEIATCAATYANAAYAAYAADAAAEIATCAATYANAYAAYAADAAYAANAAYAAYAAAYAAANAYAGNYKKMVLGLILELCAMSTPVEVVPVRSHAEVLRMVCKVEV